METREERKARLAALRASASRKREAERAPSELYEDEVVGEDPQEEEGDEEGSLGEDAHTATGGEKRQVRLKFRNYQPRTAELKERRAERKEVQPLDVQVQPALESFRKRQAEREQASNLQNLAPSKANFDLKRDVAKRLKLLERRTQEAIIQMIKEKVQTEGDGDTAAGQGTSTTKPSSSSLADAVNESRLSDVVSVDDYDL